MTRAYIALRDLHEDGGPAAGERWERAPQGETGWTMLTDGDVTLACFRANSVGSRGLFAVLGPVDVLEALANGNAEVMPAREAWRRRAETKAKRIIRHWPWWIADVDGERARVRLIAEGEVLPATMPTVGAPWVLAAGSVSRLYRPMMGITGAGRGDVAAVEDEPDRSE